MNGIYFDIDLNSTTLVASDAHKLICYTTADVQASEKASFILHKKPAAILKAIIGKDVETVEVAFDSKNAVFTFGQTVVICRLVVGKYPKYRDVIPQNNSNVLQIDRVQLLNTVRRVSVCSNKASNHIKLELQGGQLTISAQDLGFSIAAHETLACLLDVYIERCRAIAHSDYYLALFARCVCSHAESHLATLALDRVDPVGRGLGIDIVHGVGILERVADNDHLAAAVNCHILLALKREDGGYGLV
jgi:hypothetical protein